MEIGDREAEAGILNECIHERVRVDVVRGLLFLFSSIRHYVIQMAAENLST